jgi:hypothetical protein
MTLMTAWSGAAAAAEPLQERAVAWPGQHHAGPEDHGLFEPARLFVAMEADLVLAHLYGVAVAQRLALGGLAIDIGAIRAAQVFDLDFLAMHVEHRVLSTDGQLSITMSL